MVSLSNHLHHIVHAHAPYSVGLWLSPTLRAKQPCHACIGLCDGRHLWLRFTLHAGVTLRFTTCLTSYRPYGVPLPHPTSSRNNTLAPCVIAGADPRSPTLLGPTPVVASRHREASFRENGRSDPFMTRFMVDLFQKKHPFHFQLLTRQQTTTVDYKRLING